MLNSVLMSLIPPDPALYIRPPVMTLTGGITLCRVVAEACPASMPAFVKTAATSLNATAEAAQVSLTARKKALGKGSEEDSRPVDKAADHSWSALRSRLDAYAMLPEAVYVDAKRAAEILARLFGESGLAFLTASYPEQYAIAEATIRRIDGELFADDIDRIAGKEFLENVRTQHSAYEKMVAAVLQREKANAEDFSESINELGQALVDYATKVLASVDRKDPATIAAAIAALRPIDTFREATQSRQASGKEPEKAPEDPPKVT